MNKQQQTDLYEPISTGFVVHSKSGATYLITYQPAPICTCPGFGYRNQCRHVDNAPIYEQIPTQPLTTKEPNTAWINNMAYRLTHGVV